MREPERLQIDFAWPYNYTECLLWWPLGWAEADSGSLIKPGCIIEGDHNTQLYTAYSTPHPSHVFTPTPHMCSLFHTHTHQGVIQGPGGGGGGGGGGDIPPLKLLLVV